MNIHPKTATRLLPEERRFAELLESDDSSASQSEDEVRPAGAAASADTPAAAAVPPAAAAPAAPPGPSVDDGAVRRPRAAGVRDYGNRIAIEVPGCGEIHYYRSTGQFVAFCRHRKDRHASDCRKSAVGHLAKRGSGRPLGLLTAWLQRADEFEHKMGHVHLCIPTLAQRQSGRNLFASLEGSEEFLNSEKERADGAPAEPLDIL